MADRESTEINSKLLWEVQKLAAEQSRSESKVLEDAVQLFLYVYYYFEDMAAEQSRSESEVLEDAGRFFLSFGPFFEHMTPEHWRSDSLEELFGRIERWQQEQRVEPLPDDEALRLANKELHAYRRERTGR